MARLTLLLPAASRFAGIALPPALARALGRADRAQAEAGEQALLARHFDLLPRGWPAAALTRLLDAGADDARDGAWLRVDPAHIRPDINGARLLGIGRARVGGAVDSDHAGSHQGDDQAEQQQVGTLQRAGGGLAHERRSR